MDLALFDFDGTLTTRETFPDFLKLAVPRRRLAWGRVRFAPAVLAYRAGWLSGVRLRADLVRFGLRGLCEARYRQWGEGFADIVLPGLLRADAMDRMAWHQARGDVVVVVSGGLDVYLAPWCARHGVGLLCSRLEVVEGRLSGRYAGAQCVGMEKARQVQAKFGAAMASTAGRRADGRAHGQDIASGALQAALQWAGMGDGSATRLVRPLPCADDAGVPPGNPGRTFDRVYAYGDTPEDRELLALADHAHYRGRALDGGDVDAALPAR